jgi:serine/threonine protein phosphatase PrpC
MSTDVNLIHAYLTNVQIALQNLDIPHAETLLESVQKILIPPVTPASPVKLSVGIGLDVGVTRKHKPNEDFAFAATGVNTQTQETYGLFIVADGMGGHADGRLASRLATESIVNTMLPVLHHQQVDLTQLGAFLVDAVIKANGVIYARNAALSDSDAQMGTTVTAGVVFGPYAFIVNVGDSRTYLCRPGVGLRTVTRDHSWVADQVARGYLAPEAIYTHPQRNKIYRSLGTEKVQVDLFFEQLHDGDVLLFCSDGVWEMIRDEMIKQILASCDDAAMMAERLVNLAIQQGGHDNVGLTVGQIQMNVMDMPTVQLSPIPVQTFAPV